MAHYRTTLDVPRPADEVFAALADFSNVARWDPGVVRSERLDEGPLRVGSRFELVAAFFGVETALVYTIVQLDAPSRVVLEADTGSLRAVDTITVDKTDGGGRVTWDAVLLPRGLRYVLDPALHLAFQWIGARATAGLRDWLTDAAAGAERPIGRK